MKLALLFWFYKDLDVCENRLQLLRKFNPDTPIYGLFGGTLDDAAAFEKRLGTYLNDFYIFTEDRPKEWKWYHGDQMVTHWFRERGRQLAWDTIFIAQWDMLVFGDVRQRFASLNKDEILLSGLRPIREVESWWWYLRPESQDRENYLAFLKHVKENYQYNCEPQCCQFIVACLPRRFLESYSEISQAELGFLEYKIPIYAQIFGIPFCTNHPYQPWWADDPTTRNTPVLGRALNADVENVSLRSIAANLLRPRGARIFHPVFQAYPLHLLQRVWHLAREVSAEVIKPRWWRLRKRFSA